MSDVDTALVKNTTRCKSDFLKNSMRNVVMNIQIPPSPDDNLDPLHDDGPFKVSLEIVLHLYFSSLNAQKCLSAGISGAHYQTTPWGVCLTRCSFGTYINALEVAKSR